MSDEKPKSGKNGCLLAGAIGCGAILLIVAIAAIVTLNWVKKSGGMEEAMKTLAQSGGALVIEKTAETFIAELGLTDAQEDAVMAPIAELSRRIKNGEISAEQAGVLAETIMMSPAVYIITAEGVFNLYIQPSGLSQQEKASARKDLNRLQHGLLTKVILPGDLSELQKIFIMQTGSGESKLKDSLSDEEVRMCITLVQGKLQAARVPQDVPESVDFGGMLQDAIEKGLTPPTETPGTQ